MSATAGGLLACVIALRLVPSAQPLLRMALQIVGSAFAVLAAAHVAALAGRAADRLEGSTRASAGGCGCTGSSRARRRVG
jgi:hypothetical protein